MTFKRCYLYLYFAFLLAVLAPMTATQTQSALAQTGASPTPAYDPLAEPVIPENPDELDLGHNWYWHNCMTCHGDVGQGLTDEFRAIWPEDHQNCWNHGCHGGRQNDEGFPIPTVVPALVDDAKLAQFSSQQAFFEFLKSTHPPQDPGCLEDEQYQAIVKYVFSLNDRPLDESVPTPTMALSPPPTSTPSPGNIPAEETSPQTNAVPYLVLGLLLAVAIILGIRTRLPKS